jgi:hypothetical protein
VTTENDDDDRNAADAVREAGMEVLVDIEHLPVFRTPDGLYVFGAVCEGIGHCIRAVVEGRRDHAVEVARALRGSIVPMIPEGQKVEGPGHRMAFAPVEALARDQRRQVEESLEDFISALEEAPDNPLVH